MSHRLRLALMPLFLAASTALADDPKPGVRTLTGKDALGDFSTDAPGVRRKITVDALATPYDTPSAMNFPRVSPRPEGAWPKAPADFEVTEFAKGLQEPPRRLRLGARLVEPRPPHRVQGHPRADERRQGDR
jgi:hypothetical protein